MKLFQLRKCESPRVGGKFYGCYDLTHTAADFRAAVCFIVGLVMVLSQPFPSVGTSLFLTWAVLFAAMPTLRLVREIKLYRRGAYVDVAPGGHHSKAEK